jgi:rhamnogalacturonan endolyase
MPAGADVTLTQSGSNYVLSNGLVKVTVNGSGQVTQVSKGGKDLMGSGNTLYVSESGGSSYYSISASSHSIVQQSADLVELSFVDTSGSAHDMDWDIHYVMRRGVSGFYYFLITKVGTSTHPNPATLSELRTVQRFDAAVLSNGYNGERHGALPTAAQNATFSSSTQIEDATYPLTVAPMSLAGVSSVPGVTGQHYDDGPVFSKYDWATFRTEDLVHGLYGSGYGAWLLSPSWEFYTGGPEKQELMVHHQNLILNMYHGGHYGSAITLASPSSWQKIYGPNLVYVNTGADDAVIADALAQGASERRQWPYCWMKNAAFPLAAARGTVSGTIREAHGRSVDGAMVVLAAPGQLLTQGYDYLFWSRADAGGSFTIPAVRPGSYAVHVYATQGEIVDDPDHGEIIKTIDVAAGGNDVGTLTWSPPYHANPIFAIGTSDRRSGEFRFDPASPPGIDNTAGRTGRMYGPDATHGVWTVPPSTLTYTVGTSTPQNDWYFVQSADGTWTVSFDLPSVPSGGAVLTLGIAGAARNAHLDAAVNGHAVLSQGFGNDQSLYRSALQAGSFSMLVANVPAADLVAGHNAVTLTLNTKGSAGAGVYYDIVELESD